MRALVLALLFATASAAAQQARDEDADAAALSLPGESAEVSRGGALRAFVEPAWTDSDLRDGTSQRGERLSLDVHYDARLASAWRAVFADRLDVRWQDGFSDETHVNTLKEAYLSWQFRPEAIADLGRINARYGVAYGYNPTDYFRAGAVRSIVSIDPASLRENRQGSVMARGQALWTGGSLTALYSPKLADQPSDAAFNADLGATNGRNRGLLAASERFSSSFNPQGLLYGEDGGSPQLGLNLTALPSDAAVAYVEWSGGRSASLASQALALPDDTAFRSRLATGVAYTTATKLTLTLEYQYDGAGLDAAGWNALRRGPSAAYAAYRKFAANVQDPPTKERMFFRAFWQDALLNHLDLTANVYFDIVDSSRQVWTEARYHWTRLDVALQWSRNSGSAGSEYGALPERQVWQALARYYF